MKHQYQNNNSPSSSSSSPLALDQKRRLFPLAIAVSMFTLTVAGLCLLRGMENILASQGPRPTLLSSDTHGNMSGKSKLHRHLVKKEMNKKSAADIEQNAAIPAKAEFKDFISSPLSLFVPFFSAYSVNHFSKAGPSNGSGVSHSWTP